MYDDSDCAGDDDDDDESDDDDDCADDRSRTPIGSLKDLKSTSSEP